MLLAEANQWPADVRPYFGDGDEFHMAFHFPLMPRLFMAMRREDRTPIIDIMQQTPDIPDNCQWAIFLRNHDELTLEMVTDEERDYMYREYAKDPRMRINLGIRRRLAPLMDNGRRRIELLHSLLFTLPGTPGHLLRRRDRHGRQHLPGRPQRRAHAHAVDAATATPASPAPTPRGSTRRSSRTRSTATRRINVEAQERARSLAAQLDEAADPRCASSYPAFGLGKLRFLNPANRKVLAFIREYEGETILCVCNLSRFAQPAELDLREWAGLRARGADRRDAPSRRSPTCRTSSRWAPTCSSGSGCEKPRRGRTPR